MSEIIIHTQQNNHQLISDEVQEIISYRPHWFIRRGNMIFLIVLLFLLSLTWFIQYPDIVNGSARLVALNPPKLISSKAEGKLVKLFVSNEEQVQKNQHLAYIESTTDYNEVMNLKSWVEQTIAATQNSSYEILNSNPLPSFTDLGELQSGYQIFQNEWLLTKQTLASGYYQKKKNALGKDLQYLSALKSDVYVQKELLEKDQQLQQTEFEAYEKLAKEKVIAPLELNQYKSKLISKEQSLKQTNTQITNSDISSHSKQKEIMDLQKTISDQQQQFHSSLLELKSKIELWIQQYVLVAAEGGKLVYINSLKENELISAGQALFYIEPRQTQFYAELQAGQRNLGKIKKGQRVMLKVESYPSTEFGYLTGMVNYISSMPNRRDSFLVKVDLPNGLQTNYDKTIYFRNSLLAQAEIITDDRRLSERFWGQLKQITKR